MVYDTTPKTFLYVPAIRSRFRRAIFMLVLNLDVHTNQRGTIAGEHLATNYAGTSAKIRLMRLVLLPDPALYSEREC